MIRVEILKFGSSVLRTAEDLPVAVDEIYRRFRDGCRVLAVVSAFEGVTNRLLGEARQALDACTDAPTARAHRTTVVPIDPYADTDHATAAYVATGEQRTAALLTGALQRCGLPARLVEPREIGLIAAGQPLESEPASVDVAMLDFLWSEFPILVLPGFYGVDTHGRTVLFGRGGSDLSAIFLASALQADCRLLKDVAGVFDADPAQFPAARRFVSLSWQRAFEVAGPLIQPAALHHAHRRAHAFEVGRPNGRECTRIGVTADTFEHAVAAPRPLRLALVGCGTVGGGVYAAIRRYAETFDLRHVLVREAGRHPNVEKLTTDPAVLLDDALDVIVVCIGGLQPAGSIIRQALGAGRCVVTANKAVVAAQAAVLAPFTKGPNRRLWYSSAVGAALPALEMLTNLTGRVREIRGILNGTCGVVLDAWSRGLTRDAAIARSQALGFAEQDPSRDIGGRDAADKLSLLIAAAFDEFIDPDRIPTRGIDTISGDVAGYKLIARAARTPGSVRGVSASVAPERPAVNSFLGQAQGPENRLEVELETGEIIRIRAQGAGRWPTTVSVMGDLQAIARQARIARRLAVNPFEPSL